MNVFSKRVYNLIPHLRRAFLARHFLIEPLPDGRDAFGLEPEQACNVCLTETELEKHTDMQLVFAGSV